jgi:hypothetical protein
MLMGARLGTICLPPNKGMLSDVIGQGSMALYVISGKVAVQLRCHGGTLARFDIDCGGVWLAPAGTPYHISNALPMPAEVFFGSVGEVTPMLATAEEGQPLVIG